MVCVEPVPLSSCLADIDTAPGRERTRSFIASRPYPRFEPALGRPGLLVRIDADGARTIGTFVGREFNAGTNPAP